MVSSATFATVSIYFLPSGSDTWRIGVYRGDFASAILVGQTNGLSSPTTNYSTKTITAVSGQNLAFTAGASVAIAVTINGSTVKPSYYNAGTSTGGIITSANWAAAGFPSSISGITGTAGTVNRICLEMTA
jgi:hypothetical protein